MAKRWSCDHCGQSTTDDPQECEVCSCSMCRPCSDTHDEFEVQADLESFCSGPEAS